MKLRCYREQHSLDGVSVLTLASVDIPAADVLGSGLADVTPQRWMLDSEGYCDAQKTCAAPQRFRYRVGAEPHHRVVEAEGMISGCGNASLLSFLESRYVPDEASDRVVDRLLLQLARKEIARPDWLKAMEEVLSEERKPSFKQRGLLRSEEPLFPPFVLCQDQIETAFFERRDGRGCCMLWSLSRDSHMAIVSSFMEDVESEAIPRWRFAIRGENHDGFGCWDGRRYRLFEDFDQLPEALKRSLEHQGQVVVCSQEWFTPLPDLKAQFLLRVPFRSEVAELREPCPPPAVEALRRASFMVDTRRPVTLRGRSDMDILHEPEMGAAVLTRCTPRGVFVPEMPPAPIQDVALSEEGQPPRYLAGCWLQ